METCAFKICLLLKVGYTEDSFSAESNADVRLLTTCLGREDGFLFLGKLAEWSVGI
jgi:hypothetical protein